MNLAEWNEHWRDNAKPYLKSRTLRGRTPIIQKLAIGKVADIGCGVTSIYTEGDDVTGVDISPECIRVMQECYSWGTWLVGDAAATGLRESEYDTVVCSHVLEHVLDQRPIIEELKRIVKPDGNIVIVIPRLSIGHDHVHPEWFPGKIEDRITAFLKEPVCELVSSGRDWVIQGKKTATVSVVMIAWSPHSTRQRQMIQSVRSLKEHTSYPHQWVVVDNGPSKQTEFITKMEADVHIVNKCNQGPPVSRNMGAFVGDTDYIAFVDNDMLFAEGWLTDSIALLEKYPNRKFIVAPTNCPVSLRECNVLREFGDCTESRFAGSGCWVMKRRAFNEVGRWSHSTPNDVDYAARAVDLGYSFICRKNAPVVKHLAWHRRTFQAGERFVDGHWISPKCHPKTIDKCKRYLLAEYARKLKPKVFVETAAGKGNMLKTMLLTRVFDRLYSFTVNPAYLRTVRKRFRSFDYIHCDHGGVVPWFSGTIQKIQAPTLFWFNGNHPSSLIEMIHTIVAHRSDHIVLIDTACRYETSSPGIPTLEQVKCAFPPEWTVQVIDDIIRATGDMCARLI